MPEYISREVALEVAWHNYYPSIDHYCTSVKCATRKDLEAIPAADVVEVRHGRWKLGICQECLFDWSKVSLYANVPNYCPSCGAKMDGGQDDA